MPDPAPVNPGLDDLEQIAATWVLRIEAGLSPAEEAELADWLAADPRHERCLAEHQQAWDRFAPLDETSTANQDSPTAAGLLSSRKILRFALPTLAAAAAIALGFFVLRPRPAPAVPVASAAPRAVIVPLCEQRTLEDGSVVQLNRGAAITVAFTAGERRVQLQRGEAHFQVAKNAARPFIVSAGGVEVRAVGTAFDVRFDPAAVEVVVTEGRVQVQTATSVAGLALAPEPQPLSAGLPTSGRPTMLDAGQRAFVSLAPSAPAPVVATLTLVEIEARLAWQPKLLDYDDAPLAEIVAEFNRRNPMRLVVDDPALAALRLTATIRSDNMDAFVRLMESNYGVHAEVHGETEIILRRK